MSVADPSLEIQKAIVAKLKADPAVNAIVAGRIYDMVPGSAVKPYVSIGPFDLLPEEGDCLDGAAVVIQLDGWADKSDPGPPPVAQTVVVKRLGKAIAAALDEIILPLDVPQRMVDFTCERIQYLRDPDNITAHAVVTMRAMCEPVDP